MQQISDQGKTYRYHRPGRNLQESGSTSAHLPRAWHSKTMANHPLALQAWREGHLLSSWDMWETQVVESSLIPFCSFSRSSHPQRCGRRGAHHRPSSSIVVSKDGPGVRGQGSGSSPLLQNDVSTAHSGSWVTIRDSRFSWGSVSMLIMPPGQVGTRRERA